jgi:predicted outer membrane repeat protein
MAAITAGAAIALAGFGLVPADAAVPIAVPCNTAALATAISTAPSGSLLALAPLCTYSVINELPPVNNTLSLVGSSTTITLSTLATPPFPLLRVNSTGSLTITNVNFTNGMATNGGALFNLGTLMVSGGLFNQDQATASGGAIYNSGILAISGAIFTNDRAGMLGGAILNAYRASIRDCHFTGNNAHQGGATANEPPKGGPIQHDAPQAPLPLSVLNVANSSYTGNAAEIGGGDFGLSEQTFTNDSFNDNGGTVTDEAGAIFGQDGTLTVTHTVLTGNQGGNGGAILINGTGTFISDNITGNSATTNANGLGGGIYFTGQITVTNSKISSNTAVSSGGGIFAQGDATITGTQIFLNSAGQPGGGIFNRGGTITLSHSPVYKNTPDNCSPPGSVSGCIG